MSKKKKIILNIIVCIITITLIGIMLFIYLNSNKNIEEPKKNSIEKKEVKTEYRMSGNGLEKFDLAFLKFENNGKNMVYSPLSIKYTLEMLAEGADGNTRKELDAVIGDYVSRAYTNSKNKSFANALFVKESSKENIKEEYITKLKTKYNAEVIYDPFNNPNNVNKWINNKTLGLIDNMVDDVNGYEFLLANALGIDMAWNKRIQASAYANDVVPYFDTYSDNTTGFYYSVAFRHEIYKNVSEYDGKTYTSTVGVSVMPIEQGYRSVVFNTNDSADKLTTVSFDENGYDMLHIAAIANKYDLVSVVGEDNVRNTITNAYKQAITDENGYYNDVDEEEISGLVDKYIEELNKNYKHFSSSTDFEFYDDENIKMFAKDLKKYDGTQLQYIGIMPKKDTLKNYVSKVTKEELNDLIGKLKDISLDSFDDGYITMINGYIPTFNINYQLDLNKDLKTLGLNDIFDKDKINLSKLTTDKNIIIETEHKANIEFSNEGIKASAVTLGGGLGDLTTDIYEYEVPVKKIDLTFNNPYMYLVRDKSTGEVWFIGTVYEPLKKATVYEGRF